MENEYTPLEVLANKFLIETDTMQFSQMELLTMFHESLEQSKAISAGLKEDDND